MNLQLSSGYIYCIKMTQMFKASFCKSKHMRGDSSYLTSTFKLQVPGLTYHSNQWEFCLQYGWKYCSYLHVHRIASRNTCLRNRWKRASYKTGLKCPPPVETCRGIIVPHSALNCIALTVQPGLMTGTNPKYSSEKKTHPQIFELIAYLEHHHNANDVIESGEARNHGAMWVCRKFAQPLSSYFMLLTALCYTKSKYKPHFNYGPLICNI